MKPSSHVYALPASQRQTSPEANLFVCQLFSTTKPPVYHKYTGIEVIWDFPIYNPLVRRLVLEAVALTARGKSYPSAPTSIGAIQKHQYFVFQLSPQ